MSKRSRKYWAIWIGILIGWPIHASESVAYSTFAAGCSTENTDTGKKDVSIKVGSQTRSFIRVVSPKYDHTRQHALVIGYHGYGLDANSPRYYHKWPLIEEMADDDAIFIYANAAGPSWNSSVDLAFFDEIV